ncbi:MAG TPA: hypothetical protein VD866_11765 [Urbifossiella sp.]|nr:hypothetical protein [Urbifossiella sp.]
MTLRRTAGLAAGLVIAAAAVAQEPKVEPKADPKAASTAQKGEWVPATFRAFLVADGRFPPKVSPPVKAEDRDPRDRSRKMHDLVGEYGLSPVVAVFVRSDPTDLAGSGVVKLAQALDKKIPEYRGDKLSGFVHFLWLDAPEKAVTLPGADGKTESVTLDGEFPDDEKRDDHADAVLKLANEAKAPNVPFGLVPGKGRMINAWGLKADDKVTVVIYNRMRVKDRWVYPAAGPTDEQVATIIKAAEDMIANVGKDAPRP